MSLFAACLPPPSTHIRPTISKAITARSRPAVTQCGSSSCKLKTEHLPRRRIAYDDSSREVVDYGRRRTHSFEDVFIASLVAAGSCRRHRPSCVPGNVFGRTIDKVRIPVTRSPSAAHRCFFSSHTSDGQEAVAVAPARIVTRAQYERLVNTYPSFRNDLLDTDPEPALRDNVKPKDYYPLAPRLVIAPEKEMDNRREEWQRMSPESKEHSRQLWHLRRELSRKLGHIPLEKLWDDYQKLPGPRPRYLEHRTIERLFRHLAWVEFKDSYEAMERYFNLLDECIGERVPLTSGIWNSAILFAGRWLRHSTSKEVKGAIETWMRMEQYGHQADHITFNILFQVAVRAGRFALADTIFNELRSRGMPLDRFFRANLIYYAGARRDGEGVRQAFRELVNAGEIVDTGVMNAVILSFFRAGEPAAAEHTFYKMKELHEQKFGAISPPKWQMRKELTSLLNKTGHTLREEKRQHEASFFGAQFSTVEKREEIQRASPIAPDALTYRIIIKYHTYTSGDIDRIRDLLAEMHKRGLHVHGSVYVHLLRGFHTHGGYAFSSWNRASLEDLWSEMLTALAPTASKKFLQSNDSDKNDMLGAMMADSAAESPHVLVGEEDTVIGELDRPPYFTKSMALCAIRAFYKCTGKKRTLEVWHEILTRWTDASEEDRTIVRETVQRLGAEDSIHVD